MLSVKCVCVVRLPANGEVKKVAAAGNGFAVSNDPRSMYRYSNFHVQFAGSQYENLPSIPPPTAKPTLVFDALKLVAPGVIGIVPKTVPVTVLLPETLT